MTRHVLIVDDDEGLSNLITKNLEKENFEVITVKNADSAIKYLDDKCNYLNDNNDNSDDNLAMLLDMDLPDMSGRKLVSVLNSRGKTPPFLVMTGEGDERTAVEMMKLGAMDYLVKNIGFIDTLPSALHKVFNEIEMKVKLQKAESDLLEQNRLLEVVLNSIQDVIGVMKPDLTIERYNSSGYSFVNSDSEQVKGRKCFELIGRTSQCEECAVLKCIESKKRETIEKYIPETGKYYLCRGNPVLDIEDNVIRVVEQIIDVTDRKNAEEERIRLEEQLHQAQKMESVGRLAGGVAHDFNNMLGVILGFSEMAISQVEPSSSLHADLMEIRKAAERSASLTKQLLAFARRQTISPISIDINETVKGMIKMLKRLIGEDVKLSWLPGDDLWKIRMDPSQIDQILANLCVNSKDAMHEGGRITIATGNENIDPLLASRKKGFKSGEFVCLMVNDNGCGMDREILEHLFEPFFTTKESGQGTGLGLATVYGIVKQNGGFIDVYSEKGQGTSVKIYIPRHFQTDSGVKAPSGIMNTLMMGTETILLVEDEPAILAMSTAMLKRLGYNVIFAHTAEDAMKKASEFEDDIDLMMTDVIMPDINGKDLADRMKKIKPGMKCLFMSGYTADVIASHGVLDENIMFIQKPFLIADLSRKVRQSIEVDHSKNND